MNKKVLAILLVVAFVFSSFVLAVTVNLKFLHRWTQEPDRSFFEEVVNEF